MRVLYDKSGFAGELKSDYPIATTTAIEAGDLVTLVSGKVVKMTDFAGSVAPLGVAAEYHENGDVKNTISVLDSATAVVAIKATGALAEAKVGTLAGAIADGKLNLASDSQKVFKVLGVENGEAKCVFAKHFFAIG